ncbi:response regulator [Acidithiobacillus ferriphilus]|uniref:response regulator n=1 Tax=Acidithiobacillus ferriphilus TaxID=1689834 RepID=UPI001C060553|nr:response regulator [Acidithiobacillus ferriphilus]MBU2786149.1 response regulator [Acidithiobacillus ferriphilus]MEB8476156.1 response regulator [Acidithiobacillus ferriphilus]UEP58903.1 response regulator [Acidithiobacillus ferriphilus]
MQIGVDCDLAVGNRRIFVLDTDEIGRMAVQFMLHDEYETHEIASLQVAIAKAQDWPPDLIILGEALLGEGKLNVETVSEQFPKTRLMLVVGEARSALSQSAISKGFVLLHKPLRLEDVRAKVAAVLQN